MEVSARVRLVILFFAASIVASVALLGTLPVGASSKKIGRIILTSADLGRDRARGFPETYTPNALGCSGRNLSPPLKWSEPPPGTKSYIVTLSDPDDHANPSGWWWHWIVYDIPAATRSLRSGAGIEGSTLLPTGARQGRSDLGTLAYHGPCPNKGEKPHRYTFTIYALDVAQLAVDEGASGAMVVETALDHVLGKGSLVVPQSR